MNIVKAIFLALHMIGLVGLLATLIVALRKPIKKLSSGTLHSAWLQLVSGFVLAGIESGDENFNHVKIGIKLLILIAILVLGYRNVKKDSVSSTFLSSMLGLVILNVIVAVAV